MKIEKNRIKSLASTFGIFIFIAALLFLFVGCQKKPAQGKDEAVEKQSVIVPVQAVKAVRKSVNIQLDIVGSFDSLTEIPLAPQIAGRVVYVNATLGQAVREGEVLVRLDPTDQALQVKLDEANLRQERARLGLTDDNKLRRPTDAPSVKKAKAVMDNAKANWERNVRMRKEDLISQKDLENAEKDYQTSQADYESALEDVSQIQASIEGKSASLAIDSQKLQYTVLRSPLNGFIKASNVDPGDYVTVGQTAISIVDNTSVYMIVQIPQNFIDRIKMGKKIVMQTDAIPGKSFHGKVTHISPVVDAKNRTVTVKAKMENPEFLLKPGMFGTVTIITDVDPNAIVVPKSAILDEMGESKVFVIRQDGGILKAQSVKVTKGQDLGDDMQVVGDVKSGDVVAISALSMLVDGIRVNITEPENSRNSEKGADKE